jgi:hypothetical protein
MKSRNWLGAHRRIFLLGGITHVTVPDCLKQGVLKCHLYDPDLNPGYAQLSSQYATAVVAARPDHPKDKAIVEGLVKILMRYVRFRHRTCFTSLAQNNQAPGECVERINKRRHSRFGVSRRKRFETLEKRALALSTPNSTGCLWRCLMLTSTDTFAVVKALCAAAPKRSIRLGIK